VVDFMTPDRIVVGADSERARKVLEKLYLPLTRRGRPLVVTSTVETAELIKYAANAFLATKITFINELARLCEAAGADIEELATGVGLDSRIGRSFLATGPGFGGSCFPKDLRALVKTAKDFGSPVTIIETVLQANDAHKSAMVDKIRAALGGDIRGRRLGVLGLAFKANTDDMRDAPSLTILPPLVAEGAEVVAYDPEARGNAAPLLPGVDIVGSLDEALKDVDAAIVLTEWNEFRSLSWSSLAGQMRAPVVIDLRNIYDPQEMAEADVTYISLGRGTGETPLAAAAAE
jgi:UDPglucose 6-dehydrogenase